jgi:hypothetical protein
MRYYIPMFIIVIPSLTCLVINSIIFTHVYRSSRRIQPQNVTSLTTVRNPQQPKIVSRRDIHLLRHMILMFSAFVIGWGPVYLILIIMNQITLDPLILRFFSLLAEISIFCDIIDLYLYNHALRQYLQGMIIRCG